MVREEDFAHLYAPGFGRPSIPPSVMVRAMSRTTHDRTSDAETSRRTRLDFNFAFDAADQAGAITCPAGQRPATVGRIDAAKRLGERSAVEYVSRHDLHPRRQDCASSLPGVPARHRTL